MRRKYKATLEKRYQGWKKNGRNERGGRRCESGKTKSRSMRRNERSMRREIGIKEMGGRMYTRNNTGVKEKKEGREGERVRECKSERDG